MTTTTTQHAKHSSARFVSITSSTNIIRLAIGKQQQLNAQSSIYLASIHGRKQTTASNTPINLTNEQTTECHGESSQIFLIIKNAEKRPKEKLTRTQHNAFTTVGC